MVRSHPRPHDPGETSMTNFLVTRFLGRLKVNHGAGHIEFELRSPAEIEKRGARILLHIDGLGDIPRFEDGMVIHIKASDFEFVKEEDGEVSDDRRGDVP